MTQPTEVTTKSNTGQNRALPGDRDQNAGFSAGAGTNGVEIDAVRRPLVEALQRIADMGPAKIGTRPLTVYQIAMAALGRSSPFQLQVSEEKKGQGHERKRT